MAEQNIESRSPIQKRSIDKRANIVRVTQRLLIDIGYEQLSIRKIAQKAGVPVGTIYFYFRDKNEIVTEILSEYQEALCSDFQREVESAFGSGKPLEAMLRDFLFGYKDVVYRNQEFHKATMIMSNSDCWASGVIDRMKAESLDYIVSLIAKKLDAGKYRVSDPVLNFIISQLIESIIVNLVFSSAELDENEVLGKAAHMIAMSLSKRPT